MSKLAKRKSIVLVGKSVPTLYEIQQENKKEAYKLLKKHQKKLRTKKLNTY